MWFLPLLRWFAGPLVLAGLWGCATLPAGPPPIAQTAPQDRAWLEFAAGQVDELNGDLDRARERYRNALALDPGATSLRRSLISVLVRLGRTHEAITEFQPLVEGSTLDPQFAYLLGELYESIGDTATAEATYRHLIAGDRGHSQPFTALGLLQLKEGYVAEGLETLSQALRINDRDRSARRALVQHYFDQDRLPEAEGLLRTALREEPEDSEWLGLLARVRMRQGARTEALDLYRRLLLVNDRAPMAHSVLGQDALDRADWNEAVDHFSWLVRVMPTDPRVRRDLGWAYLKLGRWDEAREQMLRVEAMTPDDAFAHLVLGEVHRQKQEWRKAAREFRVAAHLAPDLVEAGLSLAAVSLQLGDRSSAGAALDEVRERLRDPQDLSTAGTFYLVLGQPGRARAVLEQAKTLDPKNAGIRFLLGRAYQAGGDFDAAVASWLEAVRLDPELAEAYNHLGYVHAERGLRLDQAVRWTQRAVTLDPQNGNYHDSLGWAYFKLGQYERALTSLQQAVALFKRQGRPVEAEIYDHLGETHYRLGHLTESLSAWKEALLLDPADAELRRKAEQLQHRLEESRSVRPDGGGVPTPRRP